MDKTEREKTTEYASTKVKSYLASGEYISALLLASIYVNIRLRSILTYRLDPPKEKWKYTSNALDSLLGFSKLVNLCEELKLVHDFDLRKLKKLWERRCKVAHESDLWRELPKLDKNDITQLCESAIEFLQKTNF